MPVQVERIPGEPIIVASLSGRVNPYMIYQIYSESAKLADEVGHVYRITDVRDINSSFGELVMVMADASRGQPGSPSDPRITSVLVGRDDLARIYSEGLSQEQYGSRNVPLFASYDEAMDYLREQMAQKTVG